jgi:hypothetical protein
MRPVSLAAPLLVSFREALCFLVPAVMFAKYRVIGELYLSEFILAALIPMLLLSEGARLGDRRARKFLILAAIWLCAQCATDLVCHSSFQDYARGWSKIGFTIVDFCALYMLLRTRRQIMIFAAGLVAGTVLMFFVAPNVYAAEEPWKFGLGPAVTVGIVLLALVGKRLVWPPAALAGAAVLNIVMGFRSASGICFLTAVILWMQRRHSRQDGSGRGARPWQAIALLVVVGAAGWLMMRTYERAAESGVLGEAAERKYEAQGSGRYGLLLGGRSETLISLEAISDSPLIGHGSWAKDPRYAMAYGQRAGLLGYRQSPGEETDLIPTHSHLFGAWVESGFLGALCWIWCFSLAARTLLLLFAEKDRLSPLIAFVAVSFMWDILFSPYGGLARLSAMFYVVTLMNFLGCFRVRARYRDYLIRPVCLARMGLRSAP